MTSPPCKVIEEDTEKNIYIWIVDKYKNKLLIVSLFQKKGEKMFRIAGGIGIAESNTTPAHSSKSEMR